MDILTGKLRDFADVYVKITRGDRRRENIVLRDNIIQGPIMEFIRTTSDIPIDTFIKAGSVYEGVPTQNHDFDIMLIMKTKSDNTEDFCAEASVIPGYARLKFIKEKQGCYKGFLTNDGYLNGKRLMSHLESVTTKAISAYESQKDADKPRYSFKNSKHGPAMQITMFKLNSWETLLSVDLVMCFQVGEEYFVTKIYNGSRRLVHEKATLMRQSFSLEEKHLMKVMDRDGGCRKELIRIIKAYIQEDPSQLKTLVSYHIKTAFLWYNENSSLDWSKPRLGERFIDFLKFLESQLRTKSLRHFFVPEHNLLEEYKSAVCVQCADRLLRIIYSPQDRDNVLCRRPFSSDESKDVVLDMGEEEVNKSQEPAGPGDDGWLSGWCTIL